MTLTEASSLPDYNGDQASVNSRGKKPSAPFIYPMTYSHELVDFNVWDLTFMNRLSSGLTINQFGTGPRRVLDLGCGCGSWAIEMARKYPECLVVGLDIFNVQPKLQSLAVTADLSRRVKWMQGDFLRPLEFPDCTFDMVRISYASLGIPEDKWQGLLEEIHRVLVPGGTLEVIEEDLIFPCSSEKPSKPAVATLVAQPETASSRNSTRTHSMYSYDMWSDLKTPTPTSTENTSRVLLEGQELDQYALPRPYELDRGENALDHSKLKAAWEEMLSARFLTSQVTSVLPLYLSTIFQDYRALPALDILLPPRGSSVAPSSNSGCRRFSDDGSASAVEQMVNPMLYRRLRQATVKEEPDTSSVLTGSDAPSHFMSSWAPMHLARMVAMIKGCKENIWLTYEKLYGEGPTVVDNEEVRVRQKEQPKGPQLGEEPKPVEEKPKAMSKDKNDKTTTRDDFETAWFNWESDMTDRIGMRNLMQSSLRWNEPSGDPPEWRVWRNRTSDSDDGSSIRRSSASAQAKQRSDVCRSVRGFVAWKQCSGASEGSTTSHHWTSKGPGMPQDDRSSGHAHSR